MRVKARKRKIVPIVANVTVDNIFYMDNARFAGMEAREKIERIIGKKVLEFCKLDIIFPKSKEEPVSVTARTSVVYCGEDAKKRKC